MIRVACNLGFSLAGILVALIVTCQNADAGGVYCGRSYYSAPTYYSYPTYYPTYYPVVQEKVVVKEVQVPYAKPVFLNKDYYFSVGEYYRDQQRDDVLASAAAYKALLLQTQMLAAGQAAPAPPAGYQGYPGFGVAPGARLLPGHGAPPAGVAPPLGQPPQGVAPPPGRQSEISERLRGIIDEKCMACHQGQPRRMNFTNLQSLTAADWALAHLKVHTNKMPKAMKGQEVKPLSDEEVKEFANQAERMTAAEQ